MNVLVFNCGSSSPKYKVISMPSEEEVAGGEAQRIGPKTAEPSRILHRTPAGEETFQVDMPDHAAAGREVIQLLAGSGTLEPHAIGHRMVHGGSMFRDCAVVTSEVIRGLEDVQALAPLHNPPATDLVRGCQAHFDDVPQVVVFDTAFHATIPAHAHTYALPRKLAQDMHIRKYGFHGTSHEFVANEAAAFLGISMSKFNAVSCHLGSGGASLCAIANGESIDNTMGYSPLQGLMMSTRCGDIDPAVALQLLARTQGDAGTAQVSASIDLDSRTT